MNNRERYDINVYKRDTWDGISLTMNYTDANGNVTGPMDLTDTNITLQVKINASDDDSVLQFSTSSGSITITDATNGKFRINATNINLNAGTYYYDIQFNFVGSNKIKTYIYGTFNVTQDVTQLNIQ